MANKKTLIERILEVEKEAKNNAAELITLRKQCDLFGFDFLSKGRIEELQTMSIQQINDIQILKLIACVGDN